MKAVRMLNTLQMPKVNACLRLTHALSKTYMSVLQAIVLILTVSTALHVYYIPREKCFSAIKF